MLEQMRTEAVRMALVSRFAIESRVLRNGSKPCRIDLVLERNIDLAMLDALVELAKVMREILEEIEAFAKELARKSKRSEWGDTSPRSAAMHRARQV